MKLNRSVLAVVAVFGVMMATGCKRGEDAIPQPEPPAADPAQAGAPAGPGSDDPSAQPGADEDRGPRRARKHKGRHGGRRHGPRRHWGGDPARAGGDPGAQPAP